MNYNYELIKTIVKREVELQTVSGKTLKMGNRPNLYVVAAALFPIAFAGFVIGFGCPVWRTNSTNNVGLWQNCAPVVKNCSTLNFDEDGGMYVIYKWSS